VAFPARYPSLDHLSRPVDENEDHIRSSQPITIAALQSGAGDESRFSAFPLARDPSGDCIQPWPAILIVEWNSCGHLGDIRRRMKIVSFLQLPMETFGEHSRHR
jgi:hypothetical protein